MGVDSRNVSSWVLLLLSAASCQHVQRVEVELPSSEEYSENAPQDPTRDLRVLVRSSIRTGDEDAISGTVAQSLSRRLHHQPWLGEAVDGEGSADAIFDAEIQVDAAQRSSYWSLLWGYLIGSAVGMVVGGLIGRATVPEADPYPVEDWRPGYILGGVAHGIGEGIEAAGHVVGGIAIGGISGGALGIGVGALFIKREVRVDIDSTVTLSRPDRTLIAQRKYFTAETWRHPYLDTPELLVGSELLRHQAAMLRELDLVFNPHLDRLQSSLPYALDSMEVPDTGLDPFLLY